MNLTQIKDEVARRYGFKDFDSIHIYDMPSEIYDDLMLTYSLACQEQIRRDCAELCKLPSDKQAILKTPLIK